MKLPPPALEGQRLDLESPAGRVSCYASVPSANAGGTRPLLLVHSVNAAASAFEMKPLYERYRVQRPVYALDLPGFGGSDRSARRYDPRLMTDAVKSIGVTIRSRHPGTTIDLAALSLSCEFAARAVVEDPGMFASLALISPTGFSRRDPRDAAPGATRGSETAHRILAWPPLGPKLFGLLTTRPSIAYFLRRTYGSRAVDPGLIDYAVITSHCAGAEHAPLYFLSGLLFSADAARLYRELRLPVWMSHGVRGDFVDYRNKTEFEDLSNWRFDVFSTGALPHFEQPQAFVRRYDEFLSISAAT